MKKIILFLSITSLISLGAIGQNADGSVRDAANTNSNINNTPQGNAATGQTGASSVSDNRMSADGVRNKTDEKKGCFRIASLSLMSGMNKYRELGANEGPQDKMPKGQHSWNNGDMEWSSGYGDIMTKNFINLELGLNPWSKKKGSYNMQQELSISLFYSGSDLANHSTMEYFSTPGDTFIYNGVKYQTDTVSRIENVHIKKANVLGAGAQYLFKSDPERRFSVFAGVGLDFAYALTAREYETYAKDSALVLSFYEPAGKEFGPMEFDNGVFLGGEGSKTKTNSKASMFTSVYVPFGVSMRLCKKKEIWNQFNLVLKGNLGLETAITVGSKTHYNPFMGMSLGLKFDFK